MTQFFGAPQILTFTFPQSRSIQTLLMSYFSIRIHLRPKNLNLNEWSPAGNVANAAKDNQLVTHSNINL